MELILTRTQFAAFARRMGVRPDWHEPDEQELGARVVRAWTDGESFDNAGFWPRELTAVQSASVELHVIFSRTEVREGVEVPVEDLAAVNLATLCSWAAGGEQIEEV